MSRAGEWFYQRVRPFPRLAAVLHYVRNPELFFRKALGKWTRRRRAADFQRAVARGGLVVNVDGPPGSASFSVAMPVYRVAEHHLQAAIASVIGQTYQDWELILLDDASPDPHVARTLDQAVRSDARIRSLRSSTNQGIAVASNLILNETSREYVAFLDHDDMLHPRALELVARHLVTHPTADWIFSDEDKIDESGHHREPCFKPGWSHHLLLAFNYVCHFRVVRRSLLERIGGHREGFDGAQDYDLALRALAAGGRFSHLPGILYHWRTVAGSMAAAAAAKPAAQVRALRALEDHARSWGRGGAVTAEVLLAPASFFRVRRRPDPSLDHVVVVPASAGGGSHRGTVGVAALTPDDIIGAVAESGADIIVAPPSRGFSGEDLDELIGLLQVPGTGIVGSRGIDGVTVSSSGWDVGSGGELYDPWRGLHIRDPGYLNLAMVPGPRLRVPASGWVGWRSSLVEAWDAAADAPAPWRLVTGLDRLGLETIVTPTVSFHENREQVAQPIGPAPQFPCRGSGWFQEMMVGPRKR